MEINPEILEVLKQYKINSSQGLLCLLGIYYKLDVANTCNEETIKAINLTKIVERDYDKNTLVWNMPLFLGQQTEWDWVKKWNDRWNVHMARKDSLPDVTKRMQEFFRKYPKYRAEDVINATDNYFRSTTAQYLMGSARFIFDGQGALKKSTLLAYCEKLKDGQDSSNLKGRILS